MKVWSCTALAAAILAAAGCGTDVPDVPDAGELEDIRGALLDSYKADRFGAALEDVKTRAGADATLVRVEVIPTRISFDAYEGPEQGTSYIYDGQGEFERTSDLRTPDERKRFPISIVQADAPERIFEEIKRLTGIADLKFNSAYLQVSVFELKKGPLWEEGGGNSAAQSVSFSATPDGRLIEQVGGNFEAPAP